VRSKPFAELDGEEAKQFLTDLAVRYGVASTQNQAFAARLFLFSHLLDFRA
jgi:hypothetical protein